MTLYYKELLSILEPLINKNIITNIIFPMLPKTYIPSEEFEKSLKQIDEEGEIICNKSNSNWYDYINFLRKIKTLVIQYL